MADYGRIKSSFWRDPTVRRSLDTNGKLLALYYLSSPNLNAAGIYCEPLTISASYTGMTLEDTQRADDALVDIGFIARCYETEYLWIKNFIKYNQPPNVNVWRHIDKLLCELPKEITFIMELFSWFRDIHEWIPEFVTQIEGFAGDTIIEPAPLEARELFDGDVKLSDGDHFEDFWKSLNSQRKSAKGEVRKAFLKSLKHRDWPGWQEAARLYNEHVASVDKIQFSKLPATWLRSECFTDEAQPSGQPVQTKETRIKTKKEDDAHIANIERAEKNAWLKARQRSDPNFPTDETAIEKLWQADKSEKARLKREREEKYGAPKT